MLARAGFVLFVTVACSPAEPPRRTSGSAGCPRSCPEVDAGERDCCGGAVRECSGSQWVLVESCALSGEVCVDLGRGLAECRDNPNNGPCADRQERCSAERVETCADGAWSVTDDCGARGEACVTASGSVAACAPGDTTSCTSGDQRCSGASVQTCAAGAWSVTDDCAARRETCVAVSSSAAVCEAESTESCTNGIEVCRGAARQRCSAGAWTTVATCAGTCIQSGTTTSCQDEPPSTCDGSQTWVCRANDVVTCDGTAEVDVFACDDVTESWCYDFGGTWQAWCVAASGAPCAFSDGGENSYVFACGTGGRPASNMGCDASRGCVSGRAACTASTAAACIGNSIYIGCMDFEGTIAGQPYTFDCTGEGNGTAVCVGNLCRHAQAGARCIPGAIECDEPLLCTNGFCR